jgi:hypothetical protein
MDPRSQILGSILHIAPRLVCSALNLIELAFGFQAFIAGERTNGLLDAGRLLSLIRPSHALRSSLHLEGLGCPL